MQLAAWTSSTEKTVMATADAPEALPELSNEASGAAASKGSQQITGWQVHSHLMILTSLVHMPAWCVQGGCLFCTGLRSCH